MNQLASTVGELATIVSELTNTVGKLTTDVSELTHEMFGLKKGINKFRKDMNKGFSKSHESDELIIKFANEELINLKSRVEKLEKTTIPNI